MNGGSKMQINLGNFEMPINSATKTFAILAKRGAGKTYTGAVLAEEFDKNNIPIVVFDPIDVWWGLKLNKDGKSKGLPIVVFGLEHADIKLERDMGRKIAQAVVKHNISAIINTFGMPKVAQRHLIAEFAEELLNINNTPRHVFIEEAHEYVPQRVFGGLGKTFNAVSNLVVMGRNRGIGVTLINQRAATLNKDVLTQLDTLLAFRNVSPQDRKALKEWVEHHSAEGDFEKFMASLPTLPTGEGWIWSPEFLGVFQRIKIRKRETFHPDREKIGTDFIMPELDKIGLEEFITEFQKQTKTTKEINIQDKDSIKEAKKENQEIISLRNDYESKILQKDMEIRKRDELLNQIRKMLSIEGNINLTQTPQSALNANLELWLGKLSGYNHKTLKFLAENSQNSFSREQITLGVGGKHSNMIKNVIPMLKRNLLIKEENGRIKINPNL